MKRLLKSAKKTYLIIIILSVVLMVAIVFWLYDYVDKQSQQQKIAVAIEELESYREILEKHYQQHLKLPLVGVVLPSAANPTSHAGCDIDGSCPLYYERILGQPNKAFMAKVIENIDSPNRVFMAFIVRDKQVFTYCGPWAENNMASVQKDKLPKKCKDEVRKILDF